MPIPRGLILYLLVWTAGALLVGLNGAGWSGVLYSAPLAPQVALVVTTAALALLLRLVPAYRQYCLNVPLPFLIRFHAVRFVGIYFLILYSQGQLPRDFAVKGGVGDILAAALGLIVAAHPTRNRVLLWNGFGLVDIGLVVAMAIRNNRVDPASMDQLRHLPLSLLPTLIVPVIIVTHTIIGYRARLRWKEEPA
jgi:hypothetical protein